MTTQPLDPSTRPSSKNDGRAPAQGDKGSLAAQALAAAGDAAQARDVGALDDAAAGAAKRLGRTQRSLVERLIYGPAPDADELRSGAGIAQKAAGQGAPGRRGPCD